MADPLSDPEEKKRRERLGVILGITMALCASLAFAAARAGILGGLKAVDLIFARFVVASLIMLPVLWRHGLRDLAGIGLRRGVVLAALGGAPFALMQTGGYGFAPLAHGAIVIPATVTIVGTICAAVFLRERIGRDHLFGGAIVLAGIVMIGWDGILQPSGEHAWVGDLLFFLSSVLWAGFTLMLRQWRLQALPATAAVAVLSALVTTPAYLLLVGSEHLRALPLGAMAFQGLMQGGLSGALVLLTYSQTVVLLGVGRAVLFPAIVPAASVLIGIPIVGEIPSLLEVAGLALVTLGLLTTIGLLRRLAAGRRPLPG
jgi:drug/metabolite transporter (DMT)-like permease